MAGFHAWYERMPASVDEAGKPTEGALPDFVILLGPDRGGPYRTDVETVERQ